MNILSYIFRESSSEVFALLTVFGLAAYRFLPSVNRIMGSALTLKNSSDMYLIYKRNENYFSKNSDSGETHNTQFPVPNSFCSVLLLPGSNIHLPSTINL